MCFDGGVDSTVRRRSILAASFAAAAAWAAWAAWLELRRDGERTASKDDPVVAGHVVSRDGGSLTNARVDWSRIARARRDGARPAGVTHPIRGDVSSLVETHGWTSIREDGGFAFDSRQGARGRVFGTLEALDGVEKPLTLTARADGCRPSTRVVDEDGRAPVDFVLERATPVAGVVLEANGTPAEGVILEFRGSDGGACDWDTMIDLHETVTTDFDGRFRASSLPDHAVTIVLRPRGRRSDAPQRETLPAAPRSRVTIVLDAPPSGAVLPR